MAGSEQEGYGKSVKKLYNKAFHEFEDERISNANVRQSVPISVEADGTIVTITIPTGQQLRLIYLNFRLWEGTGRLIITQTGGTAHALPTGQVDCLESGTQLLGTLKDPIHILEGTVTFAIEGVTGYVATGCLSFWGDQNKPQIDP